MVAKKTSLLFICTVVFLFQLYHNSAPAGVSKIYNYGNPGDKEIDTEHRFHAGLGEDLIELLRIGSGLTNEVEVEMKAAEAVLEEAKRKALYKFRKRYYEVLKEKIQADSYFQLKNIYQNLVELLKKRYRYKESLLTDVLKAKTGLVKANNCFLNHKDRFNRGKNLLAESLGIDAQKIEIAEFESVYYLPTEERLVDAALRNRGDIKYFEAKAFQMKKRASAAAYEEITLVPFLGYSMRRDGMKRFESVLEVSPSFSNARHFRRIKGSRVDRLNSEESYWRSEAKRVSREIKKDIRSAYDKYLLEGYRSTYAVKEIDLRKEEARIEKSKLDKAVKNIKTDPASLLRIEAEIVELNLKWMIARCEMAKSYYELLYLTGVCRAEELFPRGSRDYGNLSGNQG